jgi:DNA-binding NarL/FixJ family response regulator
VRIVIAEDSTLFREGLASLLADAGHDIVARVPDAMSLLEAVREHRPELAIVDVRMPPDRTDDGARTAAALRLEQPDLGIVLLSQHIETSHSVHLVSSGGFGYLLKDRVLDVDDLLDGLRRVAAGGSALDPEVVSRLIGATSAHAPMQTLTPRERDVLAVLTFLESTR